MTLHVFTLEEKTAIIHALIVEARNQKGAWGSESYRRYEILKAIGADLRARQEMPRSLALGELHRALQRVKQSKTPLGYDPNALISAAQMLINKWPFVSQALEHFGEESAE